MTAQSRATLKGVFEQGDKPQGTDYENLIDSAVNMVDTTAQSLASPLSATEIITPKASVASINVTGIASLASIVAGEITVSGAVSAAEFKGPLANIVEVSANEVRASSAHVTYASAANLVAGVVSAGSVYVDNLIANVPVTASVAPGTGIAVPASVQGFLEVTVSGAVRRIPYF